MEAKDIQLTPKELRELMLTVRQNQATLATLSDRISDMHRIVAGNGDYQTSLVGRMQIMEERQKVGAVKQDEMCDDIADIKKCLEKHNKLLEKDHERLERLETGHEEMEATQGTLQDTINAWRNKAIGVGIGAGVGTGSGLFLVAELINRITGGIP